MYVNEKDHKYRLLFKVSAGNREFNMVKIKYKASFVANQALSNQIRATQSRCCDGLWILKMWRAIPGCIYYTIKFIKQ